MDRRARAWAASGAMALTGRPDGPGLGGPPALIDLVRAGGGRGGPPQRRAGRGRGRRARPAGGAGRPRGPHPSGARSAVAAAPAWCARADGWLAVSLARPDDVAALAAWLCARRPTRGPLAGRGADRRRVRRGRPRRPGRAAGPAHRRPGLGRSPPDAFGLRAPHRCGRARPSEHRRPSPRAIDGARVVDLSSLWAGPLCGQLLAAAGADVVKVESTARPDGARQGPAAFFDLLNGVKRSVALDLRHVERPASTCGG